MKIKREFYGLAPTKSWRIFANKENDFAEVI
jgi:hypothetical protein